MMRLSLLLLVAGCASMVQPVNRFIRTDDSYQPQPIEEPALVIEQKELDQAKPFRCVGVLEVQGSAHDSINYFLKRVAEVGARQGCEVLAQRDLFELTNKLELQQPAKQNGGPHSVAPEFLPTRAWYGNGIAVWQFLCGVRPADDKEAVASYRYAVSVAAELRDIELGNAVCDPYTQTGSHRREIHGCGKPLVKKKPLP
jgi:hypothetical protein